VGATGIEEEEEEVITWGECLTTFQSKSHENGHIGPQSVFRRKY
jgi:hypothetical protein